MTTIIQDYKNYRNAKATRKLANDKLNDKFQEMLRPISLSELTNYRYLLGVLTINGEAVYDGKNTRELAKYMDENASKVHLPSCFCAVLATSYLKPQNIIEAIVFSDLAKKDRAKCTEDNVVRCVHNRADGVFNELYCADCPVDTFKNLLDYHCLKADLQNAQNAEVAAKQKLLSRLPFTNQK